MSTTLENAVSTVERFLWGREGYGKLTCWWFELRRNRLHKEVKNGHV